MKVKLINTCFAAALGLLMVRCQANADSGGNLTTSAKLETAHTHLAIRPQATTPLGQDSIISRDTVLASTLAPGYWAALKTVDYMAYDQLLDGEARSTAYLQVKAFHGRRVLFNRKVAGTRGVYWDPIGLEAVAADGSFWMLFCTDNHVGMGSAAPIDVICLDRDGAEIKDLGIDFDPYVQNALFQLDDRQLVMGGKVLDMEKKTWSSLGARRGADCCSDTIADRALLVIGIDTKNRATAFFYSLPDLALRLSFPCDCAGPNGIDDAIDYKEKGSKSVELVSRQSDKVFVVDLVNWRVDSSAAKN